jgi:Trk K+ transport system NAD-binding subunit
MPTPMKFLPAQLAYLLRQRQSQRNIKALLRYLLALACLMLVYSVLFHFIMLYAEGERHSWITGAYWTLTVMTTLGFGDITFESDIGRFFSMVVMLSGVIFLLTLLPFTFIQFFYAPWIEAQAALRTPRALPEPTRGHVILTGYDPVSAALVKRLTTAGRPYAVVVPDLKDAQDLSDQGVKVVVGDWDDPATFTAVRAPAAALLLSTQPDPVNTNITFTARTVAPDLPIVATATSEQAEEILRRAGANHTIRLSELIAQALSRATTGGDAVAHVVAEVDEVLIAEAGAARTPLVGKPLREAHLRDLGISVIGMWDRGVFTLTRPDTVIGEHAHLLLAGSREQLDAYNEQFAIYNVSGEPALILGGGRVGRATAAALRERGMQARIVESNPAHVTDPAHTIIGDAARLETLEQAGIRTTPAVLITTHDDNLNIYLTIFCRSLRPDAQIIARSTHEKNVATLHRAGADHVMSYAGIGAWAVSSILNNTKMVAMAEGLDVIREPVPPSLSGVTVKDSGIREKTGCTIVAVRAGGESVINPPPTRKLAAGEELVLVGGVDSHAKFRAAYLGG